MTTSIDEEETVGGEFRGEMVMKFIRPCTERPSLSGRTKTWKTTIFSIMIIHIHRHKEPRFLKSNCLVVRPRLLKCKGPMVHRLILVSPTQAEVCAGFSIKLEKAANRKSHRTRSCNRFTDGCTTLSCRRNEHSIFNIEKPNVSQQGRATRSRQEFELTFPRDKRETLSLPYFLSNPGPW